MYTLVVLSAVVVAVFAAPKPSVLATVPVATSHSERIDIHSSPLIASTHVVAAEPIIEAHAISAPIVQTHIAGIAPVATSHTSRVDIHSSPIIAASPLISAPLIHQVPVAHAVHAGPIVHSVGISAPLTAYSTW